LAFGLALLQLPAQQVDTYAVQYIGLKEGLSSRDIKDIFQDKRGIMWIATANGLNRYDGYDVKVYSNTQYNPIKLPSSRVWGVAEDDAQNLLICTDAGLVGLDPSRRHLVSAQELGFPDSIMRQANARIERLSQGKFLLQAGAVIYLCEKQQLKVWARLPTEYMRLVKNLCYSKKDSTLYVELSNTNHGLIAIQNGKIELLNFKIYTPNDPIPSRPFERQHYSMLNNLGDSMTLIWRTSNSHSLLGINRNLKRLDHNQQVFLADIFAPWKAVEDYLAREGDVPIPHSFRNVYLRSCIIDDQKRYWIKTDAGVFVVKKVPKSPFRQFDFLKGQSVRLVTQDSKGSLLIGTYKGLFKYNLKTGQLASRPNIKVILAMAPVDDSHYWMSLETYNGLRLFDNQDLSISTFHPSLPPMSFICDFAATDSAVWLATKIDHIYCLNLSDGRILDQAMLKPYTASLPSIGVKTMLRAKDASLWIASEGGLYRVVPDAKGSMIQDTASVPNALKSIKVNALYEDSKGQLWMGTDGQGLARLSPDTKKLQWYSSNDGLAHNVIYSILGSHHDSLLWVGTLNGLSCLNTSIGIFSNYYQEDGLADNEFNTGAAYESADGNLYFGGVNGITYFDPAQCNFSTPPVKAFINIEVLSAEEPGVEECWFPVNHATVIVPSPQAYLEIRFLASDVLSLDKIRYRYTISGLYDQWQHASAATNNRLIVTHLAAGEYKVSVQAMSLGGAWSEPYYATIKVLPHFYQTWWFRTLAGICIIALLYGIYRFRIWQLQQEYKMRSQIVNDLHDDLGGRLYAMRAIASKIASPNTQSSSYANLVHQLDKITRNTYAVMRDFIWAFDPQSDRLEKLIDRMLDFTENTIRPLIPKLQITNNTHAKDTYIAPATKHHALMIYQELLINMAKHTLCDSLKISFSMQGQNLKVYILNQHNGLSKASSQHEQKGQGSIQLRLSAIKAQWQWQEQEGAQEVIITIPL